MAINTTLKEMPTGDGYPTAGNAINRLNFLTCERNGKVFLTRRVDYAWQRHTLHRQASRAPNVEKAGGEWPR